MKTVEKAAVLITLFLFLTATGLTISGESSRAALPVFIEEVSQPKTADPLAPRELELININTADKDTLCQLNGIGPALAQRIIDFRDEHGPFSNIADLIDVSGIGFVTFEKLKDKITV